MNKNGQSIVEFTLIAILVIFGVVYMGPYVLRSINAHFKLWDEGVQDSFQENLHQVSNNAIPPINVNCVCNPSPGQCGSTQAGCQPWEREIDYNCNFEGCNGAAGDSTCTFDQSCCSTPSPGGCGNYAVPPGGVTAGAPCPTGFSSISQTCVAPPASAPTNCYFGYKSYGFQCGANSNYECVQDPSCLAAQCEGNSLLTGSYTYCSGSTQNLSVNTPVNLVNDQQDCSTPVTACQAYCTSPNYILNDQGNACVCNTPLYVLNPQGTACVKAPCSNTIQFDDIDDFVVAYQANADGTIINHTPLNTPQFQCAHGVNTTFNFTPDPTGGPTYILMQDTSICRTGIGVELEDLTGNDTVYYQIIPFFNGTANQGAWIQCPNGTPCGFSGYEAYFEPNGAGYGQADCEQDCSIPKSGVTCSGSTSRPTFSDAIPNGIITNPTGNYFPVPINYYSTPLLSLRAYSQDQFQSIDCSNSTLVQDEQGAVPAPPPNNWQVLSNGVYFMTINVLFRIDGAGCGAQTSCNCPGGQTQEALNMVNGCNYSAAPSSEYLLEPETVCKTTPPPPSTLQICGNLPPKMPDYACWNKETLQECGSLSPNQDWLGHSVGPYCKDPDCGEDNKNLITRSSLSANSDFVYHSPKPGVPFIKRIAGSPNTFYEEINDGDTIACYEGDAYDCGGGHHYWAAYDVTTGLWLGASKCGNCKWAAQNYSASC